MRLLASTLACLACVLISNSASAEQFIRLQILETNIDSYPTVTLTIAVRWEDGPTPGDYPGYRVGLVEAGASVFSSTLRFVRPAAPLVDIYELTYVSRLDEPRPRDLSIRIRTDTGYHNGEGQTFRVLDDVRGPCSELTTLWDDVGGTQTDQTTYSYDDAGNLVSEAVRSVDDDGAVTAQTTFFSYDAAGHPIVRTRDADGDGAVDERWSFAYDEAGNLVTEESDRDLDGVADSRVIHTYDGGGRELAKDDDSDADGVVDRRTVYTYDDYGNLASEQRLDGDGAPDRTATYTYDDYNNRISVERLHHATNYSTTDSYTYDARGNRLTDSDYNFYEYTFDDADRILTVDSVHSDRWRTVFSYDCWVDRDEVLAEFLREYYWLSEADIRAGTIESSGDSWLAAPGQDGSPVALMVAPARPEGAPCIESASERERPLGDFPLDELHADLWSFPEPGPAFLRLWNRADWFWWDPDQHCLVTSPLLAHLDDGEDVLHLALSRGGAEEGLDRPGPREIANGSRTIQVEPLAVRVATEDGRWLTVPLIWESELATTVSEWIDEDPLRARHQVSATFRDDHLILEVHARWSYPNVIGPEPSDHPNPQVVRRLALIDVSLDSGEQRVEWEIRYHHSAVRDRSDHHRLDRSSDDNRLRVMFANGVLERVDEGSFVTEYRGVDESELEPGRCTTGIDRWGSDADRVWRWIADDGTVVALAERSNGDGISESFEVCAD